MLRRRQLPSNGNTTDNAAYILAGLAIAGVAISVGNILSPFVVVAAVVYLLYPFRSREFVRRAMVVSVLLLLLWGFNAVSSLLVPFLIAYVLAYLFDPLVTRLTAHRIPRWGGSLLVVLGIVSAAVGAALFITPVIAGQMQGLLSGIQRLVENTTAWLGSDAPARTLAQFGIPAESARSLLTTELVPRLEGIVSGLVKGVFDVVTGFSSIAVQIVNVIIIPFLLFFLLKDFPLIGKKFVSLFSGYRQGRVRATLATVDGVMGRYVRGAVLVAIIQGTIAAVALWIIGVSSPLVLGVMTAFLDFIPYIGLIISLIVATLVAMFSGEPVSTKVIAVIVLYLSQKLLEATILAPKIIGSQVGLHPVVLILSLLVFGYFLGFVGLLIAVPVTALLLVVLEQREAGRGTGV
jgi:predicted PurR-regulated permease PerM